MRPSRAGDRLARWIQDADVHVPDPRPEVDDPEIQRLAGHDLTFDLGEDVGPEVPRALGYDADGSCADPVDLEGSVGGQLRDSGLGPAPAPVLRRPANEQAQGHLLELEGEQEAGADSPRLVRGRLALGTRQGCGPLLGLRGSALGGEGERLEPRRLALWRGPGARQVRLEDGPRRGRLVEHEPAEAEAGRQEQEEQPHAPSLALTPRSVAGGSRRGRSRVRAGR